MRNAKNYYLQEYFYNVVCSANSSHVQEARIVTKSFLIAPRIALPFG